MVAIDLTKQEALNADTKVMIQRAVNLDQTRDAIIIFSLLKKQQKLF